MTRIVSILMIRKRIALSIAAFYTYCRQNATSATVDPLAPGSKGADLGSSCNTCYSHDERPLVGSGISCSLAFLCVDGRSSLDTSRHYARCNKNGTFC